jgi:hypothetical protein
MQNSKTYMLSKNIFCLNTKQKLMISALSWRLFSTPLSISAKARYYFRLYIMGWCAALVCFLYRAARNGIRRYLHRGFAAAVGLLQFVSLYSALELKSSERPSPCVDRTKLDTRTQCIDFPISPRNKNLAVCSPN